MIRGISGRFREILTKVGGVTEAVSGGFRIISKSYRKIAVGFRSVLGDSGGSQGCYMIYLWVYRSLQ